MVNVKKLLLDSIETKLAVATNTQLVRLIDTAGHHLIKALQRGNQILVAGNGGSAADAQHFAAELAGKFLSPTRRPLPATALTVNTSNLTAIGNDFGYEYVFSRQLEGQGNPGDVFIGITTSGNSPNILEAFKIAREKHILTIGLLGGDGGQAKNQCDLAIVVPSSETPRIQETHTTLVYILYASVDEAFS